MKIKIEKREKRINFFRDTCFSVGLSCAQNNYMAFYLPQNFYITVLINSMINSKSFLAIKIQALLSFQKFRHEEKLFLYPHSGVISSLVVQKCINTLSH